MRGRSPADRTAVEYTPPMSDRNVSSVRRGPSVSRGSANKIAEDVWRRLVGLFGREHILAAGERALTGRL